MAQFSGFAATDSLVLLPPSTGFDLSKVTVTDAQATTVSATSPLRIATGHKEPWPGVILRAPDGKWDLSPFAQVELALRNTGTNSVTVFCRVDNPGADGVKNCVSASTSLKPGDSGTLRVSLKRTTDSKLDGKLFGLRGYPVAYGGDGTIDPANVTQLLVFVSRPACRPSVRTH